jgi:anthranilate synthase component 1
LPRFCGGLVGYFGYDTVRYIETSHLGKTHLPDPLGTPDILLLVSDEVVIFDNLRNTLLVVLQVDPARPNAYENAVAQLDILALQLRFGDLPDVAYPEPFTPSADLVLGSTQAQFEAAVEAVQAHIAAGDVMQVVLSQRMQMPFAGPPLQLYRTLRRINPSPYLYYFNLAAFHIVGSSPEILTRVDNGTVTVRPIAGTRPRGATPEADQALAAELLADPKERAEHLMLIDLGRNDIGRVAAPGSVRVTEQMIIERYSHVMHIVSNVTGQLRPGFSALDALRATFPAGTLSGAPKVRAMEIIDTLEPVKRGIYGGAVGYWSWLGNLDTAIAIRTAVIQNQTLYLQAGAGIVADSVPALEWQETLNKGQALLRAASLAVQTGEG